MKKLPELGELGEAQFSTEMMDCRCSNPSNSISLNANPDTTCDCHRTAEKRPGVLGLQVNVNIPVDPGVTLEVVGGSVVHGQRLQWCPMTTACTHSAGGSAASKASWKSSRHRGNRLD